jgi:hypothetical protein
MRLAPILVLIASSAFAADEFTLYELLPPDTHQFAITYDVTQDKEGAEFFLNPIRPGSVSTKERVIDRATGQELKFEEVTDDKGAHFIKVHLPAPVPKGGQTRIRIIKTYTDAKSYYTTSSHPPTGAGGQPRTEDPGPRTLSDQLIFERPMGIKRDVVVLPKGWELIGCGSPGIVSTDADGRVRVSFLNDRDDQLPVKIVGRKLP